MSEPQTTTVNSEPAGVDFDPGAFETPECALGVESGDALADEIEQLLNEGSATPTGESDSPSDESRSNAEIDQRAESNPTSPTDPTDVHGPHAECGSEDTGQTDAPTDRPASKAAEVSTGSADSPSSRAEEGADAVQDDASTTEPAMSEAAGQAPADEHSGEIDGQGSNPGEPAEQTRTSNQSHAEETARPSQSTSPTATASRSRARTVMSSVERPLRQSCAIVNLPLGRFSAQTRAILGYAALATFLNAAAVLAYAVLS